MSGSPAPKQDSPAPRPRCSTRTQSACDGSGSAAPAPHSTGYRREQPRHHLHAPAVEHRSFGAPLTFTTILISRARIRSTQSLPWCISLLRCTGRLGLNSILDSSYHHTAARVGCEEGCFRLVDYSYSSDHKVAICVAGICKRTNSSVTPSHTHGFASRTWLHTDNNPSTWLPLAWSSGSDFLPSLSRLKIPCNFTDEQASQSASEARRSGN